MSSWYAPDWSLPEGASALYTMRSGGSSQGAYSSFNLGMHVGDDDQAVAENRARLLESNPGLESIQWLDQIHGTEVIYAPQEGVVQADGCWTDQRGVGCAVMTADCLPVLFCCRDGSKVAAAHAGWRGLVSGVLESAVRALGCPADLLTVWLGPAIGHQAFEVGAEVRQLFMDTQIEGTSFGFVPSPARPGHYLADIYHLARCRLRALGVADIHGGGLCTYGDSERFFSYRRDGVTGRMATLIYISSR